MGKPSVTEQDQITAIMSQPQRSGAGRDRLFDPLRTIPSRGYNGSMGVQGSCHCGKVRIEVPERPDWVADCNCSLCRKLAWRVAYFPPDQVRVSGETTAYVWGDRMIGIHHCPTCGCGTHWQTLGEDFGRMGINARLLDDFDESQVEVRRFDNAD
jgi:hypothetical protein